MVRCGRDGVPCGEDLQNPSDCRDRLPNLLEEVKVVAKGRKAVELVELVRMRVVIQNLPRGNSDGLVRWNGGRQKAESWMASFSGIWVSSDMVLTASEIRN